MSDDQEAEADLGLSLGALGSVLRGSISVLHGINDETLESRHDVNLEDLTIGPDITGASLDSSTGFNASSLQQPLVPYASVSDFGGGDFPEAAFEVIDDYFSTAAVDEDMELLNLDGDQANERAIMNFQDNVDPVYLDKNESQVGIDHAAGLAGEDAEIDPGAQSTADVNVAGAAGATSGIADPAGGRIADTAETTFAAANVDSRPAVNDADEIFQRPEDMPIGSTTPGDSFFNQPCCSYNCTEKFPQDLLSFTRDAAKENDYTCPDHVNHLHLLVLGQLSALTVENSETLTKNRESKEREKPHTKYYFRGVWVCQRFFEYVNFCGGTRLRNLKQQLKSNGIEPKKHGNEGRPPSNTTSMQRLQELKTFMVNFCDVNALVLPGRVPFQSAFDPDIKLLPSSFTKKQVWTYYKRASQDPISIAVFCKMWNTLFPNIIIQKPRTDLCSECYRNTISLGKLHGLSEDEKLQIIARSQAHLQRVVAERTIYRDATRRLPLLRGLSQSVPCSFNGTMHYSMDFAQTVFLPHDSQQVGPLYFLTPYKISLFGIACEPLGKFVLYCIPESASGAGKGSNMVISLLHHFFEHYGVGEKEVYLHADNCVGQNKNNYLMQYAVWRTLTGLHHKFKLSFLPVGHTKFAPDLYFGIVKRAYRRSSVHSMVDLKTMIETSCAANIEVFMVANETGDLSMKIYDWQRFFRDHSAERLPGLLDNFHFESSKELPGLLLFRKSIDECQSSKQVFSADSTFAPNALPNEIVVEKLPLTRRRYLYEKIREFVRDECKDILCPVVVDPVSEEAPPPLPSTSVEQLRISSFGIAGGPSDQLLHPMAQQAGPSGTEPKSRGRNKCSCCGSTDHTNRFDKKKNQFVCPRRRAMVQNDVQNEAVAP